MNKKKILKNLRELSILFMAYFLNKKDSIGLSLHKRKITNHESIETIDNYLYMSFPVLFNDNLPEVSELLNNNLEGFFREFCIPIIERSEHWETLKTIKNDKSLKIEFLAQPENPPFWSTDINDSKSGMKFRTTYGLMFSQSEKCFLFDFCFRTSKEKE